MCKSCKKEHCHCNHSHSPACKSCGKTQCSCGNGPCGKCGCGCAKEKNNNK